MSHFLRPVVAGDKINNMEYLRSHILLHINIKNKIMLQLLIHVYENNLINR